MKAICLKLRQACLALIHVNWIKTLYINYHMLSLKEALHLPIIIKGKCYLTIKGGKIKFNVPVRRGLLKIGHSFEIFTFNEPAQIKIHGTLILEGEVWLGTSVQLLIEQNAILIIGNMSTIGSGTSLVCTKKIIIGDCLRLGSFADISDCNYHYIKNLVTNTIMPFNKPIKIGYGNYIGSRVAILPGTITPNNIIVGFGSVCNKDYTIIIPENSMIAGVPAKLVKENVVCLFDFKKEQELTVFFRESGKNIYYDIGN